MWPKRFFKSLLQGREMLLSGKYIAARAAQSDSWKIVRKMYRNLIISPTWLKNHAKDTARVCTAQWLYALKLVLVGSVIFWRGKKWNLFQPWEFFEHKSQCSHTCCVIFRQKPSILCVALIFFHGTIPVLLFEEVKIIEASFCDLTTNILVTRQK